MLPFKKILCPTDFSQPSYEALKTASELALHFSAELILVHVVNPIEFVPIVSPSVASYVSSFFDDTRASAGKKLDTVMRERISGEIKFRGIVMHGNPAEEIVRKAADEKADMIVIATHGLTGWRHLIFGSVAERVVRLAPCMVLTVRAPETESKRGYHREIKAQAS